MSSVKNRILQFQQQNEAAARTETEFCTDGSCRKTTTTTPPRKPIANNSETSKVNFSTKDCDSGNSGIAAPAPASGNSGIAAQAPVSVLPDPVSGTGDTMTSIPKKATTLTINLSSTSLPPASITEPQQRSKPILSPIRPKILEKPRTMPLVGHAHGSSIPKLISPTRSNVIPSPGTGKSLEENNPGSLGNLYGSLDWKEKYEESERKRLHIVSLAQKATRDYEELRRRYQELGSENEKVAQRLKSSNSQLEALRNASEAAYHDYYKLKKHYQVENSAKSQALSRVDEYNKENRKLKRQSQALMQHFTDGGNFDLEQLMDVQKGEDGDDKEIHFLRTRVQELEARVVDLESELERTKLAEFESQEATMLINDSVQNHAKEVNVLKENLRQSEQGKETLEFTVNELRLELESLKAKQILGVEKLQAAEIELRKIQAEKNVLQRQSVIFFSNNALDAQLQDALNQISEIQLQFEEQKLRYETQILDLQESFHEKESDYEAKSIKAEAKVKSLECQVDELQKRIEEAEEKLEKNQEDQACSSSIPPPPPPPPPPMNFMAPPPPPPLPTSLNSSLQTVTLRRAKEFSSNGSLDSSSGTSTPEPKSIIPNSSAQIDDVVSQIKRGIKLRSTEKRTKETEAVDNKPADSVAIEEMRSILNNLKRTRRAN